MNCVLIADEKMLRAAPFMSSRSSYALVRVPSAVGAALRTATLRAVSLFLAHSTHVFVRASLIIDERAWIQCVGNFCVVFCPL